MALRNYLYAKHVNDRFAMTVLQQQEMLKTSGTSTGTNTTRAPIEEPKLELSSRNGNNESTGISLDSSGPRISKPPINNIGSSNDYTVSKAHCSDIETCNNCMNCPNSKSVLPKVTVEIDEQLDKLQDLSINEIEFTYC